MKTTKSKLLLWVVPLIILVVLFIYSMVIRNKLVAADEMVKNQWGNLQGSYQRRADLVPQLVQVVKGVSEYEKDVLKNVAEARANIGKVSFVGTPNNKDFSNVEIVQGNLVKATNVAIGIIEKYPDIQGTKNYLMLQEQLVGTERRVNYSRRDFNSAIKEYNILARNFPSSLVAKLFSFAPKDGFKADDGSGEAPQISFSNTK